MQRRNFWFVLTCLKFNLNIQVVKISEVPRWYLVIQYVLRYIRLTRCTVTVLYKVSISITALKRRDRGPGGMALYGNIIKPLLLEDMDLETACQNVKPCIIY